jgi:hypothetical protein
MVTNEMADFSIIKTYFDNEKQHFCSLYRKYETPMKTVIRHLSIDTPVEIISNGQVDLGIDVVNVKLMSIRPFSAGGTQLVLCCTTSLLSYLE